MALQGSGQIKLTELATEFGGTAPYSLKAYYRGGGRVPSNNTNVPASGAIGLKNFYNAVNRVTASRTFSSNTTETSLNISTLPGYVAGITDVYVYVSSNVYVYSTSTASPALTITGATAGDAVYLVNNGFIIGKGGNGGNANSGGTANAFNGGPALNINYNITLTNNSYIAGGGGGGGGSNGGGGGGGAGGGQGGNNLGVEYAVQPGGAGGAPGQTGANGTATSASFYTRTCSGGGGGRILPGVGGAEILGQSDIVIAGNGTPGSNPNGGGRGGGAGGGGGPSFSNVSGFFSIGGAGGSANNVASNTSENTSQDLTFWTNAAGGGGWGAAGGTANSASSGPKGTGGSGGKAINLNGFTVTYNVTGTIYGVVS